MANNRGSSPALADHWFVVLQNALDAWGPYLLDLVVLCCNMGQFLVSPSLPILAKFAVHHRLD